MKRKYLKYIIVSIIGTLLAVSVFSYRNLLDASNMKDITLILSDSFLVPGVLILGIGILIMVSNGGIFDIFVYSFKKMRASMRERKSTAFNSFYDYRVSKEKVPYGFLIIVGGIFFGLSVIFNIMFYYV